jgi:hypothetical protein
MFVLLLPHPMRMSGSVGCCVEKGLFLQRFPPAKTPPKYKYEVEGARGRPAESHRLAHPTLTRQVKVNLLSFRPANAYSE